MTKKEEFKEEELGINPFIYTLVIPVTKVVSNVDFTFDGEEGIMHNKSFYVERTKKVSLYKCESCMDNIIGLSDKALRLYTWVLLHLIPGKDYIQLNQEYYMRKNNVKSINTYKSAITELSRYAFISQVPGYKSIYWINPNIYFSGNRLNKFPNNIEERATYEK